MRLVSEVSLDSLRKVYAFFHRNTNTFKTCAHTFIPVSNGIAQKYTNSIGRNVQNEDNGRKVINHNAIERAMYLAGDGRSYLPGSSVKGAVRTAWLEALHKVFAKTRCGEDLTGNKNFESILLQGDFNTDPLRLIKIADFMPQLPEIERKIVFACNYKKNVVKDKNGVLVTEGKGPVTRKEIILSGQYRIFASELALFDTGKHISGKTPSLRPNIANIARYCNEYYRDRLDNECKLLEELGLADKTWLKNFKNLLGELATRLEQGEVFLLRLGRYGDAETKTIKDLARIKIMAGNGIPPSYKKKTTTIWLAADQEKQKRDLLPFGWALVEVNPQAENNAMRRLCD